MTSSVLAVNGLVLARHGRVLSRPLTFNLTKGEAMHVVGANGSGKTTLLDTLATLSAPDSGTIRWQGRFHSEFGDELRALWQYCGHIDALKREWTLLENLQWQARLIGQSLCKQTLKDVLTQIALRSLVHVPVAQFSKGQQRRAALARLRLINRPLWLLDEPFSALDVEGADILVAWINEHLAVGGAVLFTTHQGYPALQKAPTLFHLDKGR